MAKLSSSPLKQKELDYEAYRYIQRALSLDSNNFAVVMLTILNPQVFSLKKKHLTLYLQHKWMFILLDKKSSYEGLKQRISQSFVVKQHIERACELNPRDGTSLHLLGYWYLITKIPKLS